MNQTTKLTLRMAISQGKQQILLAIAGGDVPDDVADWDELLGCIDLEALGHATPGDATFTKAAGDPDESKYIQFRAAIDAWLQHGRV